MKGQNALRNIVAQMLEVTRKHMAEPMKGGEYETKMWKSLQKAESILNKEKVNETNSRTAH